jgi:hypothetical protein
MNKSNLIADNGKIRQFIETLTTEELVALYKNVTTPEFVGLISGELKKNITPADVAQPDSIMVTNTIAFVKLWKLTNSPTFLVGISDLLKKEVSEELFETMDQITHG